MIQTPPEPKSDTVTLAWWQVGLLVGVIWLITAIGSIVTVKSFPDIPPYPTAVPYPTAMPTPTIQTRYNEHCVTTNESYSGLGNSSSYDIMCQRIQP